MRTFAEDLAPAPAQGRGPGAHAGAGPRLVDRLVSQYAAERARLVRGLREPLAQIEPKYFYDARGCELYEWICALPEYYLPRLEREIFSRHRDAILRELPRAPQWIDLGCGDGRKSPPWVHALGARRYIGVDIAREALAATLRRVADEYEGVETLGVACDFTHRLDLRDVLAERGELAPVFFYPGSSIGNFPAYQAVALLAAMRGHLGAHGRILVGVDLVKDRDNFLAAYADASGVTAAFNRNALRVVNRFADCDFDPERWEHEAIFDSTASRIEMRLVAREEQLVRVDGTVRRFARGERILTEYSHKYTVDRFAAMLARAGFARVRAWTDAGAGYAVFVAGA